MARCTSYAVLAPYFAVFPCLLSSGRLHFTVQWCDIRRITQYRERIGKPSLAYYLMCVQTQKGDAGGYLLCCGGVRSTAYGVYMYAFVDAPIAEGQHGIKSLSFLQTLQMSAAVPVAFCCKAWVLVPAYICHSLHAVAFFLRCTIQSTECMLQRTAVSRWASMEAHLISFFFMSAALISFL